MLTIVKKLVCPVPGNDNGGRLLYFGDDTAEHVVFFCGGFPDDSTLFMDLALRLYQDDGCFCGLTCLAGHDSHTSDYRAIGYTIEELISTMRDAFQAFCKLSKHPAPVCTVVLHDWGCVFGSMMINRLHYETKVVDKVVFMDVLPPFHIDIHVPSDNDIYRKVVYMSYQGLLAIVWLLQYYLSTYLSILVASTGFAILGLLQLAPLTNFERTAFYERKISLSKVAYTSFVYYYVVKAVLGSFGNIRKALPDLFIPLETEILYLFGKQKRVHFHDAKHVAALGKHSVCFQDAGHWLMLQKPILCHKVVRDFVSGEKN